MADAQRAVPQRSTDPAARIIEDWADNYVPGAPPHNSLYPGAVPYLALASQWRPITRLANPCYGNPLPSINGLAVHCTAAFPTNDAYGVANYICVPGWNARVASAHFAISGNGTVIQFIPTSYSAFAQGRGDRSWLSVEIDNPGLPPGSAVPATEAQIKSAQKLFAWVCKTFSIRPEVAVGHLCGDGAYDNITRTVCSAGTLNPGPSADAAAALTSRGLSCHRWLAPGVKPCPGAGVLNQMLDIASGAAALVGR
jgi:hypothetical protein